MAAIKITPADKAFSNCVRALAGWRCERCGNFFSEGETRKGLHCSHFFGRGKWGVRFNPSNASSLCYGCHQYFGSHPHEHELWFANRIGQGRMEILIEAANDTYRGRFYRRTKGVGEIAKHYRRQHALIEAGQAQIVEFF